MATVASASKVRAAKRKSFAPYSNVQRWISSMKKLESWSRINEQLYSFANAVKDAPFITV